MAIDHKIRNKNLQHDFNREVAKISVLSSGKFDKHQHPTVEEILPSNQRQITDKAKFTNSPSGKALEKQTRNN